MHPKHDLKNQLLMREVKKTPKQLGATLCLMRLDAHDDRQSNLLTGIRIFMRVYLLY